MSTKTMEIPVAEIEPIEGLNPRKLITDASVSELTSSIERHGVLMPVLVGARNGQKTWPLIAGHRRLVAARKAGLEQIPALVREDLAGAELEAAISENAQREDLTPVEEAAALKRLQDERGYTQKQAAEALGKSERWARERLRLLRLPDIAQRGFADRKVPIEAAVNVERVAKASPAVAELVVERVQKADDLEPSSLLRLEGVADVVADVLGSGSEHGFELPDDRYYHNGFKPADLPILDEDREQIAALWKEVPGVPFYAGGRAEKPQITFDPKDVKAAKKAGCLLELEGQRYGNKVTRRFITDRSFIGALLRQKLPKMKAAAKRKIRELEKREQQGAERQRDREAERERAERKEQRRQEQAAKANAELAANLNALTPPKVSMDLVRLVCSMALGDEEMLDDYLRSGLGAIDPRYSDEGEGADDPDSPPAYRVLDELANSRTPEEAIAVVLRVAIADEFADTQDRFGGFGYGMGPGSHPGLHLSDQLTRVAGELDVLPAPMQKEAARHAKERAERRAEAEKRAAERGGIAEVMILQVLDGDGLDREQIQGAIFERYGRQYLPEDEIDEAIVRLSEAAQIELREEDGEAVAIKRTPVGDARFAEAKGDSK